MSYVGEAGFGASMSPIPPPEKKQQTDSPVEKTAQNAISTSGSQISSFSAQAKEALPTATKNPEGAVKTAADKAYVAANQVFDHYSDESQFNTPFTPKTTEKAVNEPMKQTSLPNQKSGSASSPQVGQKAARLQQQIPKAKPEELKRMTAHIEANQENWRAEAQGSGAPLYIRREQSKLPYTVQVNPNGRILIQLKSKGKQDPLMMQGGFGKLKEAIDYDTGESFLTKTMTASENVNDELRLIDRFNGMEHVVQAESVNRYSSKDGKISKVSVTMEYCNGGNLEKAGKLSPEEKKVVLQGIASGLREIHARGIVHFDIKPDNILLKRNEKGKIIKAVIGDVGNAREFNRITGSGAQFNLNYLPPELCQRLYLKDQSAFNNEEHTGEKIDQFSLGLTLAQVLFPEKTNNIISRIDQDIRNEQKQEQSAAKEDLPKLRQELSDKQIGALRELAASFENPQTPEEDVIANLLEEDPVRRMSSEELVQRLQA